MTCHYLVLCVLLFDVAHRDHVLVHAFSSKFVGNHPKAESSLLLRVLDKLNLHPILGREPSHSATQPTRSLAWCQEHVASLQATSSPSSTISSSTSSKPQDNEAIMASTPTTIGAFDNSKQNAAQVHVLQSAWSPDKCQSIIQSAEDHAQWSTGRHHLYPTTDVPVRDLSAAAKMECLQLAQAVLLPALASIFDTPLDHLNFKDMFVAKYTPAGQPGLGAHTDGSAFSFNVLLSDTRDFEGGGTSFVRLGHVAPSQGDVLVHRGSLRHQGNPVTQGCRYILVGFVHSDPNYVRDAATLGSKIFTVSIPTFPLGLVLEVDEGDADKSAAMVVSCDAQHGSAFSAGMRSGDCIRGVLVRDGTDVVRLEAWDGKTFDQVMAWLANLSQKPEPLELVIERWNSKD